MYNNPLGKKPSPRSSHRKIITFISKLCRSPAARPLQPRAPSPGAARPGVCQCAGVRAGARVRVCARVCVAPRRRGNAGEAGEGELWMHKFVQSENTNTRTQKEAISADLGEVRSLVPAPPAERGVDGGGEGARPGTRKFENDGPESLRSTSFIYQKWYIYKYS